MKNWKEWISENEGESMDRRDLLSPEQLKWCEKHISVDWWVNRQREVQVENDMEFKNSSDIKEFPVQFADVEGNFYCNGCENLTSLKGSPRKVKGFFDCSRCHSLTSLKGAPEVVTDFDCRDCTKLVSLEGSPKEVKRYFNISRCGKLTSLKGAPQKVGGGLHCHDCENLASLEGFPKQFKVDDIGLNAFWNTPKLPQVEQDFLGDEDLKEQWMKSPLGWQEFMYGGAAKGRKYGL